MTNKSKAGEEWRPGSWGDNPERFGAPIIEYPAQSPFYNVLLRQVLRQVGQAESGQRRAEYRGGGIEHPLAFDMRFQLVTIFNSQA